MKLGEMLRLRFLQTMGLLCFVGFWSLPALSDCTDSLTELAESTTSGPREIKVGDQALLLREDRSADYLYIYEKNTGRFIMALFKIHSFLGMVISDTGSLVVVQSNGLNKILLTNTRDYATTVVYRYRWPIERINQGFTRIYFGATSVGLKIDWVNKNGVGPALELVSQDGMNLALFLE